jgi:hypothetical protein
VIEARVTQERRSEITRVSLRVCILNLSTSHNMPQHHNKVSGAPKRGTFTYRERTAPGRLEPTGGWRIAGLRAKLRRGAAHHLTAAPDLAPELGRTDTWVIGAVMADLPDRHLLGQPATQAWLEASANQLVAELFDEEGALRRIDELSPGDDDEFASRMFETELGLIADGYDPVRIYLRLAVVRTARIALRARTEIRGLPERRVPTQSRYGCNLRYTADGPGG